MARLPNWVLEAEVEKSRALVNDVAGSAHGKMVLGAARSPAVLALAKLIDDNPRKSEAWYRREFLALVKSDESLQSAVAKDFIRENARQIFSKMKI